MQNHFRYHVFVWNSICFHPYDNIWWSLYTKFISSIIFGYAEINFQTWIIEWCQENKFVKKINHALVKNWEISSSYIFWRICKVHDKEVIEDVIKRIWLLNKICFLEFRKENAFPQIFFHIFGVQPLEQKI